MNGELALASGDVLGQIVAAIAGALLAALVVGGLALRRARASAGEPRWTLLLIALHLIEAPVNVVLIGMLMIDQDSPYNLMITLPMAVLLIPALGLRFRDAECRRVACTLLALGALRWLITAAVYATLSPLLLAVGTLLLIGCVAWCAGLLNRLSVRSAVRRQVDQRVGLVCGEGLRRV